VQTPNEVCDQFSKSDRRAAPIIFVPRTLGRTLIE